MGTFGSFGFKKMALGGFLTPVCNCPANRKAQIKKNVFLAHPTIYGQLSLSNPFPRKAEQNLDVTLEKGETILQKRFQDPNLPRNIPADGGKDDHGDVEVGNGDDEVDNGQW